MTPNPREHIGANGGPPLEEEARFTRAELMLVHEAADLWARKFRTLPEALLRTRGKQRDLIIRRGLSLSLREVIPASTIAAIIGVNRCTIEDDQAQAIGWCERDDGLADAFEMMALGVRSIIAVDADALEARMSLQARQDRLLKTLEAERRAAERAARQAEEAAQEAARRSKDRKRTSDIDAFARRLKEAGVKNWEAVAAQHYGPAHTAERLSTFALQGLALLLKADRATKKQDRRPMHDRIPGATELLRLGLARTLSPIEEDDGAPRIAITVFGARVMETANQTPHARRSA